MPINAKYIHASSISKLLEKHTAIIPLILFFITLTLRIPLLYTEYERTPDSIDYINVAENMAIGNGFVRSVKDHYFDDKPVIASGSFSRPLLTPLLYSLLLRLKNDYYLLQAFNLFLSSFNVMLFYILIRYFTNNVQSFIGSMLIALNPNLIIESRFILSEQLFYFLVLLFFIVFFRMTENKLKYPLLGFLAGLSYLTRIEGLLLLIILCVTKRRQLYQVFLSSIAFIITIVPNFVINYQVTGNPFYTFYAYHFSVFHYSEGRNYFTFPVRSPLAFVFKNFFTVLILIMNNFKQNFLSLIGYRFLGIISIFFLLLFSKKNLNLRKQTFPLTLFAVLLFSVVVFTWSAFFQPERHLALVYMFSILLIFVLTMQTNYKKIFYISVLATIFLYAAYDIHQARWIRTSIGSIEQRRNMPVYSWIRSHVDKNSIIATRYPLKLYLFTDHPTILIPTKLPETYKNKEELNNFIKKYHISYFYVEGNDLYDYLQENGVIQTRNDTKDSLYCISGCYK
jgi:hypothetical protein